MRQPAHRVADHLHVRAPAPAPGPGSGPPAAAAAPPPVAASARTRAQRRRGGHDRREVLEPRARGPTPARPAAPAARTATPLRTASSPTPGGPPHLWALAASSDQPPGTGPQPSDCAASTSSGTPASRQSLGHLRRPAASVPTSWLADWRQTSAVSGPSAAATSPAATRPVRSTATSVTGAAGRLVRPRRHAGPRSARRRSAPAGGRPGDGPASAPEHSRVHRPRPRRGEDQLVRAAARPPRPRPPAPRPAAAGRAAPRGRAGPGRPSPRRARRAGPDGRRDAAGRRTPRRSRARTNVSPLLRGRASTRRAGHGLRSAGRTGRRPRPGDAGARHGVRCLVKRVSGSGSPTGLATPSGCGAARWAPSPRDPK